MQPAPQRMAHPAPTAYDEVLYVGSPFVQTHPDRLATLAILFGMKPAPVESCRVLELACGDGGNLIPMAYGLPGSRFVGIDVAECSLANGQALVAELGLQNITLRRLDILEVSLDLGRFDYIIAHGVYSWVAPAVRDRILAICREHLAPQGVAYVSYNAYPGCRIREMISEMMRFHVRQFAEPDQQVGQARAFVKFLAESESEPDLYRMMLREELERLTEYSDQAVYHDDLAAINSPVYFYQFMDYAARHDLQYLTEAAFIDIQTGRFPPHVIDALSELGDDVIATEQYMDFLKCRRFRQTLLCHQDIELDRTPAPEKVAGFYVASPARPTLPEPDIDSRTVVEFRGPKGSALKTDTPLLKAAFLHLGAVWPHSPHFHELLAVARSSPGRDSAHEAGFEEDARVLGETLLRAYAAGLVELHAHAPCFVLEVSERPVASLLARLQIQSGTRVTNLRHTGVQVEDSLARHLLRLLDGARDRDALIVDLAALIDAGVAVLQQDGEPMTDRQKILNTLRDELDSHLEKLARLALLVK